MEPVNPNAAARAVVGSMAMYQVLYRRSLAEPEAFWMEVAERLSWFHPPAASGRWDFDEVDVSWYAGGKLNAAYNCVDRHLATRGDDTALIWVGDEPGTYLHISFSKLAREVGRLANVLRAHGVKKGDPVCLYLPMIPELAYAMLACARIGAVHSVVFAGFSAEALRDRVVDAGAAVVITANEGLRGGKRIPLKAVTDRAIEGLAVRSVLVAARTDTSVPMRAGRDHWLHEETARQRPTCPVEWMDAEDPLFVLYTSGSTGQPKGVLHTTGGYLVYASYTHALAFDAKPGDVWFCAADIGWITGHSYIVYGPLANGVTSVIFESTPLYPDASRYWQVIDDLAVTQFYTAPTALRALIAAGDRWLEGSSRGSLRVLGSVGEPINPEVWRWYHDVVGQGRCAVVDTWWQTETGGILIAPLPGVTPTRPGSATLPLFGVEPVLVDERGLEIVGDDVSGNLCLRGSWPGQARTILGDHARFHQTYFSTYPGLYFTGDGCRRDADGYYWITGRVDDVLNVSGHRLGTAEIESALVSHPAVAEAAVVPFPHDIKGQGIYAYCVVTAEYAAEDPATLRGMLREVVREAIGPIAMPDRVQLVDGLPKTRSGKIMRRILRKLAEGDPGAVGDTSTLADPEVVERIGAGVLLG